MKQPRRGFSPATKALLKTPCPACAGSGRNSRGKPCEPCYQAGRTNQSGRLTDPGTRARDLAKAMNKLDEFWNSYLHGNAEEKLAAARSLRDTLADAYHAAHALSCILNDNALREES